MDSSMICTVIVNKQIVLNIQAIYNQDMQKGPKKGVGSVVVDVIAHVLFLLFVLFCLCSCFLCEYTQAYATMYYYYYHLGF